MQQYMTAWGGVNIGASTVVGAACYTVAFVHLAYSRYKATVSTTCKNTLEKGRAQGGIGVLPPLPQFPAVPTYTRRKMSIL